MKKRFVLNSIAILVCSVCIVSCGTKKESLSAAVPQKIITTHSWYYLGPEGITGISEPQEAPLVIKKPWTESIRISGIGQTAMIDSDRNTGAAPKAYALVNHLGIMELSETKPELFSDRLLFKDQTADGIVFMQGNPVFSLYKNIFFNETTEDNSKKDVSVLVQFDTNTQSFFPIVNTDNLKLNKTSQVTDYFWDGNFWYYCIKDSGKDKTEFSYIKWNPNVALLSILPGDVSVNKETNKDSKNKIALYESSESEFRKCLEPRNFSDAPDRIKKLLVCLPKDFPFEIEVKTAGGPSPRYYQNKAKDNNCAEGKVQLSDTWAGAVFKDGTMYFAGALTGRRILNDSRTVALRLPKLPEGFVYSDFGISGGTLYVAWEEVSFFETGRSGFLSVDLGQVLYNE